MKSCQDVHHSPKLPKAEQGLLRSEMRQTFRKPNSPRPLVSRRDQFRFTSARRKVFPPTWSHGSRKLSRFPPRNFSVSKHQNQKPSADPSPSLRSDWNKSARFRAVRKSGFSMSLTPCLPKKRRESLDSLGGAVAPLLYFCRAASFFSFSATDRERGF